jgi:uncharacterized hydrophobic protein (TIGR00341 family)
MKYVEIVADAGSADTVAAIAEKIKASDLRLGPEDDNGLMQMRLLVEDGHLQWVLDALQSILGAQPSARIVVLPVEAALPRAEEPEKKDKSRHSRSAAREALYEEVAGNAVLDGNYLLLVFLSTVVAAIGLIENNVAVVIGAMVIAPLLGPNLALSLAATLGDGKLLRRSLMTLTAGILLALGLPWIIGLLWPDPLASEELLSRTRAGLDSAALALASGAAAALSLTSGLSSVLVGVMVAVALLPPTATIGLMLSQGQYDLATGAALLLALNIICVNLATKLVFLFKGVQPRAGHEKERARRAMRIYVLGWVILLALLLLVIYARFR